MNKKGVNPFAKKGLEQGKMAPGKENPAIAKAEKAMAGKKSHDFRGMKGGKKK